MFSSAYDVPLAWLPQSEDINLTYTHCDVPQATLFFLGAFQQICCHARSAPLAERSCNKARINSFTQNIFYMGIEMPCERGTWLWEVRSLPSILYKGKERQPTGETPKKRAWALPNCVKIQTEFFRHDAFGSFPFLSPRA